MKLLIVAACIWAVASGTGQFDELRKRFKQMLGECKEIVGASDADVNQYLHHVTPDSDAGKCLISCVNKIIKIQNPDGKFNPDATKAAEEVIKGMEENWSKQVLSINEKCIKEVVDGPDECVLAEQWFTCVNKEQRNAGLPLVFVDE